MENTDFNSINIIKKVAAWQTLWQKCTIDLEESEAFELLISNNASATITKQLKHKNKVRNFLTLVRKATLRLD